jgi:hypothetical protein
MNAFWTVDVSLSVISRCPFRELYRFAFHFILWINTNKFLNEFKGGPYRRNIYRNLQETEIERLMFVERQVCI